MLKFNIFIFDVAAIVLEALPFLLIGSILGSVIEVFLPEKLFRGKLFQRKASGLFISIFLGFLLPTCECGVIPIAKKMVKKGLPSYLAVVYMFSAPVINPIVIAATYVAFRYNIWMVLGRIGISALTALVVGLVLSGQGNIFLDSDKLKDHDREDEHEHGHKRHEGLCLCEDIEARTWPEKILLIIRHSSREFLEMSKYLILGAILASTFSVLVPKSVVMLWGLNPLLSILFMMVLAVLLSICSEADAFVAASFMKFSPFSQLAFVTIGPVVDLKLLLMYSGTFKKKALALITVIPFILIFFVCNILGLILR